MSQTTLLAPSVARGASYGGSQVLAHQQIQDFNKDRAEAINTGVQGFASQNITGGLNALSGAQSSYHSQQELKAGVEAQQGDFGDFMLSLLPGATSFLTGGFLGGGSGNQSQNRQMRSGGYGAQGGY